MDTLKYFSCYIRNYVWLKYKSIMSGRRLSFKPKQLIGRFSSIIMNDNGKLYLGSKLYTRNNFHLMVNGGICIIGDNCFFNHNCSITCMKNVVIGNKCTFGNNLVLVDHDHNIREDTPEFICKNVVIKDGAWIGANVTILKGVTIGRNSVIAAGSVVNKDVPENCLFINGDSNWIKRIG